MNREDGFPIADIDVGIAHDPKVIKLARRLRDPERTAAHLGLYLCLVAESWSSGERATLEDSAPAWWPDAVDAYASELEEVGLLDAEGRIPERAWEAWFRPAADRRGARKREGRINGLMSRGTMTRAEAEAEADRRSSKVTSGSPQAPLNPSHLPAGPSHLQDRTGRGASEPTAIGAVAADVMTCDVCGESLIGSEPWKLRKRPGGRAANIHDRCFSEAQATA